MKNIRLSNAVVLPVELTTRRTAIFGISGSGKSNTATVCIEQLLAAGEQVVIVDPKGEGWGLQTSADGKKAGFDVIVFGQPRGDIPELREQHADQIADFVVDSGRSVVLSLLGFDSDQSERRFVTEFFKRLYRRKSQMPAKTRTLVVLEEAHLFIPEQASGSAGEMVGAIKRIARQGRAAGIGLMVVDQRPQDVAKSIVSQCELLICHQLVHKLDREALRDWVRAYDRDGQGEAFLASLAELKSGEAWVWSPAWLHLFVRTRVDRRTTYDSGATPDGTAPAAPKAKATVDLDSLRTHLAKVVDDVKANDPTALKAELSKLRAENVKLKSAAPVAAKNIIKTVEKPILTDQQLSRAEKIVQQFEALLQKSRAAVDEVAAARLKVVQWKAPTTAAQSPVARPVAAVAKPRASPAVGVDGQLTGPEQRILDSLAWLASIGVNDPETAAVAFLAGYTTGGGAFNNPRGSLRGKGLIEYLQGDRIRLTAAGAAIAQAPTEALTTETLHAKIIDKLPGPEQKLLKPLLANYPATLSNDELAAAAGYATGGGAYNNPRGRLRTLGLIEYRNGGVAARSILFP